MIALVFYRVGHCISAFRYRNSVDSTARGDSAPMRIHEHISHYPIRGTFSFPRAVFTAAIRQELHTSSLVCRISLLEATYPVVRLAFQVQTAYLCHLFSSHECHYDPSHLHLLSLHNFLYLPCNSLIPFPLFDFNISFPSTFYKEPSISIPSFLTFFPLRKNLTYGTAPTPVHRYNSPLPVP